MNLRIWCVVAAIVGSACVLPPAPEAPKSYAAPAGPPSLTKLVPLPKVLVEKAEQLELTPGARIVASVGATAVAESLGRVLRRSTGFELPLSTGPTQAGDIELALSGDGSSDDEQYRLDVTDRITLRAGSNVGLFRATSTLRQLLPPEIEAPSKQSVAWRLHQVHIDDAPRYAWRGLSFDVARHFFPVDDVKRLIELAAYHKLNRFHLHLTDDQGWRIEIKSWPELARIGGKTQAGGGAGGFYTQAQYRELVEFAAERHVTLVPEIDMPGHVQAALASYGELNRGDRPAEPYTGTDVGFSSLVFDDPDTMRFVNDVIGEVAALTPGRYLHVGGDEAKATKPQDYAAFMKAVGEVVQKHGKVLVGWCEAGEADLPAGSLLQDWHPGCSGSVTGAAKGMKIIASPAAHAYLDMKYTKDTVPGVRWAGYVELERAYVWQPVVFGVPNEAIVGIESALWTEYVTTRAEVDHLLFPRLAGHAELGWSGPGREFIEYRVRLAHHGKRLSALGVGFYRSPQVAWER